MQSLRPHVLPMLLMAALLGAAPDAPRREPKYVTVADVDVATVLPPPPAADSPELAADVQTLLDWQSKRTEADVTRVTLSASGNGFYFAKVLGTRFNAKTLPGVAELLSQVNTDTNRISEAVKRQYKRPRPYLADARIKPCVEIEKTTSYPSGHATRGVVWATVLAEIYPEHRDELLALGKQFGEDRVVAGLHYPSDVAAGQKLGAIIAAKLLAKPEFQAALTAAKAEVAAARPTSQPSATPARR